MKTIKFLVAIFAIISFSACNENVTFDDSSSDFPNYRWEKANKLEFNPEITELDAKYNIYIDFRHVYGFQPNKVKIKIEKTNPSGKVSSDKKNLKVKNIKGEYKSECAGDYCDLRVQIGKNHRFKEAGTYQFVIEQLAEGEYLPNVMTVGLVIEKIVKEEKE